MSASIAAVSCRRIAASAARGRRQRRPVVVGPAAGLRQARHHHQERRAHRRRRAPRPIRRRAWVGGAEGRPADREADVSASNRATDLPFLITARIVAAPARTRSIAGPSTITASICLPGSRLPTRAWRSSEYAALMVARDQRLLEGQVHAEAAERHRERHRRREAGAGVDVGGERDGDAAVDQHAARREAPELQVERRDRQQRRDDPGRRQPARRRPRRRRSDDPPTARRDRRRPSIRRSARTRRRGSAASSRRRARPAGSRATRPRVNTPVLAEHVAPLGEPLARDGRDHLADHEIDVARRSSRCSTGTSWAPMNVGEISMS